MQAAKFIAWVLAAVIVSYIPFVNWPFGWLETYFHELSHGLVALLTGGRVERIVLHIDGSGLCYYQGGIRLFTAFAGYLGAALWGSLLYLSADAFGRNSRYLSIFLFCVILISGLLWARDLITIIIMAVLLAMLYLAHSRYYPALMRQSEKFLGMYVVVSAIRAPLNLIDGKHYGDGATLSDLTALPELFWVIVWVAIGFAVLAGLWRYSNRTAHSTAV